MGEYYSDNGLPHDVLLTLSDNKSFWIGEISKHFPEINLHDLSFDRIKECFGSIRGELPARRKSPCCFNCNSQKFYELLKQQDLADSYFKFALKYADKALLREIILSRDFGSITRRK